MPRALEQALHLIRENRPESIDRALALMQNTVYSFSMKVCGHREDAEDTMQDVLLKSIPYLAKFENSQALTVWLYKVARNRCISSHRGSSSFHRRYDLKPRMQFGAQLNHGAKSSPKGIQQRRPLWSARHS